MEPIESTAPPPPLSRFAVGTASLHLNDGAESIERVRDMVRIALAAGINWFDTAPLYVSGLAEGAVGQALSGIPRDSYHLSTKTGYVITEQTIAAMRTGDPRTKKYPPLSFSYDFTASSLERSFSRLRTSHLDAVFLHDPMPAHLDEISTGAMRVLDRMKRNGAVRSIGIGLSDVNAALFFLGRLQLDIIMLAGRYTLLIKDGEELLDRCRELGVTMLAAGALNSGLLADPFAPAPRFDYRAAPPVMIARARELDSICRTFDVPLRAAALQFPLRHPSVRAVVTGPASPAELRDIIAMAGRPIPSSLWSLLEHAQHALHE